MPVGASLTASLCAGLVLWHGINVPMVGSKSTSSPSCFARKKRHSEVTENAASSKSQADEKNDILLLRID
jgi:hypothetical protein